MSRRTDEDVDEAERLRELGRQLRGFVELNDRKGYLRWISAQPGFDSTSPKAYWWALQAWRAQRAELLAAQRRREERAAVRKAKA